MCVKDIDQILGTGITDNVKDVNKIFGEAF
jgi:hypothetical protein